MTPMPASVAALQRAANGTPISHTVAYSGEGVDIRPDPLLDDALAFFPAAPYRGKPILGRADASRQRKSTLRGLCQVCKVPLGESRWICDLRIVADRTIRIAGRYQPLLVDSWTCTECLRWSLTGCPRLAQLPRLPIYRCEEWLTVATPERPKHLDAYPWGAVGYVQVAPMPGTQRFTRGEFLAQTERCES